MTLWDVFRIPFGAIRYSYREFRKILFTASRPAGKYLVVAEPVDAVESYLGEQSYAPNWEFSYYERGEVLNLARVVYDPEEIDGRTLVWWQTHVRGWENDDGELELHGHWELEPTENPDAHLDGVGFSHERGMANLRLALDAADVDYEERTIEPV